MTNWTSLIARMTKAEKDVQEWTDGLRDAEKTLTVVRGEMAAALASPVSASANGTHHKASAAPALRVAKPRHDYKRKDRVLSLLRSKGGLLTVADVASAEKCSASLANNVLAGLYREGKLSRPYRGRYTAGSLPRVA